MLFAQNWNGDPFLIFNTDEKQIAIIASPGENARCSAEELSDIISRLVQQTYEREVFRGDNRFCNVTSLCGPSSGFESIRKSYQTARVLYDLSFLHMHSQVLSESYIAQHKNTADYPTILDACFTLRSYIDEGDVRQAERHLTRLFLNTIRGSYSLALCDDALSFIKSMLLVRCKVYGVTTGTPLETLCARTSYHKVEECVDALLPVIHALCAAVQEQGAFSKPVLNAIYYIKTHFAGYLVLTDVARYVNTNASYLSSKFKKRPGSPYATSSTRYVLKQLNTCSFPGMTHFQSLLSRLALRMYDILPDYLNSFLAVLPLIIADRRIPLSSQIQHHKQRPSG